MPQLPKVQDLPRYLPWRRPYTLLTAPQGCFLRYAVADQKQRLSPTKGQLMHRFPTLCHRQAGRRSGCP